MAQIKKLQKGNVFTIDGVAHNVDDALIGRLYDHAKSLDSGDAAQFGKIIDALKNGENLSYDSVQNKLTGTVNWDLKNERQKRRVGKRLNSPGGLVADTQNAVGALKTFSPIAMYASATTPEKKAEKIKKNWSKGHALKYITDPDGTRRLANTVDNQMAKNLLNTIHEINDYGDDIEFSGYNGAGKDVYKAWLQARQGNSSTQELLKRMESGQLSDEDWMILNEVGITDGTVADPNADQKARFKKAGIEGLDWNKHKDYFSIDDSGNINVTDAFRTAIGHNGNIWFNDEWKNVNPDLDFLKGRMLWNGRLYNEADAITEGHALQRQLGQEGGFFDLLKRGDRKAANDIMNFSTDLVARERYDSKGPYYSKWMHGQGPNFWYSSMVGSHTTDGLQDGQQLIRYYNGDRDQYGRLTGAKYAILDANGNLVSDNISEDKIKKIEGSKGAEKVSLAERIQDSRTYKGMVREDIGGGKDQGGFTLFTNPNDGSMILDMGSHAGGQFGKHVGKGAVRIPKYMADQIHAMTPEQQEKMWKKLNSNEQLRKNFIRSLNQLGESRVGNTLRGSENWWDPGYFTGMFTAGLSTWIDRLATDPMSKSDWEELGFTPDVKDKLYGELYKAKRSARRDAHFVEDYNPIEKHQYGGTVGHSANVTLPDTKISRTDKTATARELEEGQLNDADYWQIGSIAGDVAALVANMSAVGAPVAAGFGLAGTGAQLVSDIKRDGFQMRDLGALAINLGLDAATLLPNAGMSSMAKIGRGLTKSAGLIKKVLMGVGAVRGVQGLTNIINGEGTLDDWKALSQGLLVGQRAIKSGRNLAATKYQAKNAKATPQTKEGIQKQYIEEFVAANKDKVGTVKGVSAEGKVTNLSEAKAELQKFEGFSLPDKMASAKAAGSQVKGFFSSKWNPFSDQFVLNAENRVLSPETMSAIKAGNSVWRSNAAHELGYLNPAIHRQIYTAGMNLPRTFGFKDPYIGNWFFRAPVFTKLTPAQVPSVHQPGAQLLLPAHVPGTSILDTQAAPPVRTSVPKPAHVSPALTVERVAVPKQVVPVVPTTSIVPVQPYVMPARQGFNPEMLQQMRSNPQFMSWLYNTFFGRALPAGNQTQALPASSTKYMLPMPSGRDANGSIITPIPEGAQFSLFKKGGKVKKVRKCENGLPGYAQGLNLGIGFDNQGNIVTIDPITGLPKEPTLAEIGRATQLREASKTATPTTATKGGNAIDLDQQASHIALRRNADGNIATRTGDVIENTSGNWGSFTQGSGQKTPYNWKPLGFMASELAMSIGSAIAGGNKAKKASRLQAEASKTSTPYESGMMYSDQHIGRAEDAAYKALDDQAPLVSNDPSLQRAYELAKAKERVNIANNANAQRSAGITAWNQEEAQRDYRNRVRGAENQHSARKAELLTESQENMIDAGTLQSVTNSLMGGVRELRKEDLYRTADKNAQHAQDAQTQALAQMQASVGNKYKSEMERDPEFRTKYNGDVMEWFASKHPGEYADMQTRFAKTAQNLYNNTKINTGILAKKGSKLRPTSDVMLIENQKHVNKSIRDLNNNLVKMFLKMMS